MPLTAFRGLSSVTANQPVIFDEIGVQTKTTPLPAVDKGDWLVAGMTWLKQQPNVHGLCYFDHPIDTSSARDETLSDADLAKVQTYLAG
jgi:hypothetical protein